MTQKIGLVVDIGFLLRLIRTSHLRSLSQGMVRVKAIFRYSDQCVIVKYEGMHVECGPHYGVRVGQ